MLLNAVCRSFIALVPSMFDEPDEKNRALRWGFYGVVLPLMLTGFGTVLGFELAKLFFGCLLIIYSVILVIGSAVCLVVLAIIIAQGLREMAERHLKENQRKS